VSIITPELSKEVGWEPGPEERGLTFPTIEQVLSASDYKLLEWHRFLPSADPDGTDFEVQNLIWKRVFKGGDE